MARKSKLSEKQWTEIGERLLRGESMASLAREFGVSKSTVSERFAERNSRVKAAASLALQADSAFKVLGFSERVSAQNLIEELRAVSMHLAGAAKYGSATAHRLSGIAHAKVQEIDDAKPLDAESLESLKGIAVLTRMANESSQIGLNLLNANKDQIKRAQDAAEMEEGDADDDARLESVASRLEASNAPAKAG